MKFTKYDYILYTMTIAENPYITYDLYHKQKLVALASSHKRDGANYILCGGPGGGGKTRCLAALALQFITEPHYRCLVTREKYRELIGPGSVFDIIKSVEGLKVRESSPIRVVAPSGAEIHFKAFNDSTHKEDVRGESYHTIINDEASRLEEDVLRYLNRSLRKPANDPLPLRFINASNPGGPSTDYLVNKYINGEYPYVEMGYRDNPFIDTEQYEEALMELDYIDRQYQMYGNWFYKPSVGDLINRDEMEKQYITSPKYHTQYNIISIDLAGKGKDSFAVVSYSLLQNGWEYIEDFAQTKSSYPEDMLIDFVAKHNPRRGSPRTSVIVIEQEGGGSPEYARKYFQNELEDFGIPVVLKKPKGSKYQRARPLMRDIQHGKTKLNKDGDYMDDFIQESIELDPEGKGKSPNLVDSASLARNYLHEKVMGSKTRFIKGRRIG